MYLQVFNETLETMQRFTKLRYDVQACKFSYHLMQYQRTCAADMTNVVTSLLSAVIIKTIRRVTKHGLILYSNPRL